MISIRESKLTTLQTYFRSEISKYYLVVKDKLEILYYATDNSAERKYLKILLKQGEAIISGSLAELATAKRQLDDIFILNSEEPDQKEFKELILLALQYSDRRTDFYPKYFRQLGIKACVYCNSQLAVTVEDEDGSLVGKFQVDHHLPKDIYPGLSIWLSNLIPSCSSCNNKKGIKEVYFNLYSEGPNTRRSEYSFSLTDKDKIVASYLSKRDPSVIEFIFQEPTVLPGKFRLNELFAIEGIYQTQVDIIEDLILKTHIYDDSFKQELMRNFGVLFDHDPKNLDQLLLGNYIEESEIHRRPLSKFMQDIGKQLGLIS